MSTVVWSSHSFTVVFSSAAFAAFAGGCASDPHANATIDPASTSARISVPLAVGCRHAGLLALQGRALHRDRIAVPQPVDLVGHAVGMDAHQSVATAVGWIERIRAVHLHRVLRQALG